VSAQSEADVGAACDQLARHCGWTVELYEQNRVTQICAGLPDRRYVHRARGGRIWVELKAPGGKLTEAQHGWLEAENAAGGLGVPIDDVMALAGLFRLLARHSSIADGEAKRRCVELTALTALRGYRGGSVKPERHDRAARNAYRPAKIADR